MDKALKEKYPNADMVTVGYDPGASETNQLNRIRLMRDKASATEFSKESKPVPKVLRYAPKGNLPIA